MTVLPRLASILVCCCLALPAMAQSHQAFTTLEQGWTWEERERFWSLGQGSEIIPYRWFLFLEQAGGRQLFNSPDNIRRLGYIPWADNPEQLPIGFTRAANPHDGKEWLGLNCSACHTNTIIYDDKTLLIDGAPTLGDYWKFNTDLAAALEATLAEDDKFARFADAVLPDADDDDKLELRNRLQQVTADRLAYNQRNAHHIEYGYGRLDALGFIFNEVTAGMLKGKDGKSNIPENVRSPEAPVSYPFLWSTSQADYVQWNGVSYAQLPLGNLARDVVEVLGVYGKVEMDCDGSFKSSLIFDNSIELADMVATLKSPQWPNDIFPPIDPSVALQGESIYQQYCAECHEVIPREQWDRPYSSSLWPMGIIGTDAQYARSATQWVSSGCLQGKSIFPGGGEILQETDLSYSILSHMALSVMLEEPGEAILPLLTTKGFVDNLLLNGFGLRKPKPYYKARPLNGIWATAPYLHNGSVPTLDDLLLPPVERPRTFKVGCHEFDPDKVGFRQDCADATEFRVELARRLPCDYEVMDPGTRAANGEWIHYPYRNPRLKDTDGGREPLVRDNGNCNIGHDIRKTDNSAFNKLERRQLVEYLKTL